MKFLPTVMPRAVGLVLPEEMKQLPMDKEKQLRVGSIWIHIKEKYEILLCELELKCMEEGQTVTYQKGNSPTCYVVKVCEFLEKFEPRGD